MVSDCDQRSNCQSSKAHGEEIEEGAGGEEGDDGGGGKRMEDVVVEGERRKEGKEWCVARPSK